MPASSARSSSPTAARRPPPSFSAAQPRLHESPELETVIQHDTDELLNELLHPDRPRRGYDFDGRKVYFGNLSWGMDHLDLQDLCGEFGTVEDARLITDRETNRSRGFGFVTMSTVAEAEEVVDQLNGQDVDGRVLRVNIANVDK